MGREGAGGGLGSGARGGRGGRGLGMAGGKARRAAGYLLGAALAAAVAVMAPGGAQGRQIFNDGNMTKIDSSRFFRDIISSDEAWMVAFLTGSESDHQYLQNLYESLEEIANIGHPLPKVGYLQILEDTDRVVATKLGLMEEIPTVQGFHVKKDKDAMVELADSSFGGDSVDLESDFIRYFYEWQNEFPPVGEDRVVMKVTKVDTGKGDDL